MSFFMQFHFNHLIFIEFTIGDLKTNIGKYEGSIMYNLFLKELKELIFERINIFERIYGIEFKEQAN